ncbi:MAG: phosphoglycerate mutase family protein [Spirochaetes bacterium]|nr:phosphoglycerate mutase family protein [Spirochaetota bacterium]
MSKIFFIRHGQASFGKGNYDVLSPLGKKQSYLLGKYFVRRNIVFDAIYRGTLTRHLETEEEIKRAFYECNMFFPKPTQMTSLNEYDSYSILTALVPELIAEEIVNEKDLQNIYTDRKSFQRVFEATMLRWVSGKYNAKISSWCNFVENVYAAISEIMQKDGRGKVVAVITSGGPISVAIQRALALSDENAMRITWQIKNASFTRFKCTTDSLMLESFNEVPHLEESEVELVSYR